MRKYIAGILVFLMMLPSLQAFAAEDFTLSLSTKEVHRGGKVIVSGTVPDDRSDVVVKMVSPSGTVFFLEATKPIDGHYSVSVTIPAQEDFSPLGKYTVAAGYRDVQKTAAFTVSMPGSGGDSGNGGTVTPPNHGPIPADAGQADHDHVKPELNADGVYIAGKNTLAEAINAAGTAITIELPVSAAERGDALELPAESIQAMEGSGKELRLTSGSLSMRFPAGAIKTSESGDARIRVTMNTSWTAEAEVIVKQSIRGNDSLEPVGLALSVVIELVSGDGTTVIHEMEQPVSVTLKLTKEQASKLRLELAGVYDVDGQNATYVRGVVRNDQFTFDASHFSYYAVLEYDKQFADMANHWAEASVKALAAKHIVTGVDELHYQPERSIKRADFATMLIRSLGWRGTALPEAGESAFTDVEEGSYYANAVAVAAKLGIITGYNGKFRPDDRMTREEAATALARALTYFELPAATQGEPTFGDQSSISDWAQGSVREAWAAGLIQGDDKGNFNPKNSLTRAQVAAMMERALNQHS